MNTTARTASRTRAGLFAPVLVAAASGCFIVLALRHAHDATWLGMGSAARFFIAGASIFAAVGTEWIVIRQKKLIGNGHVAQAIVDDVCSLTWSSEHSAAYYHFFTEDRRVITSRCAIDNRNKDCWSPGCKITAIYDPVRPARHVVSPRLWAVRWQAAA
jgi:hypothetical protein